MFDVVEVVGFDLLQNHGGEGGERRPVAVAQKGEPLGTTAGGFGVQNECTVASRTTKRPQ